MVLESWDSMRSGLTGFSSLLARGRSFCIFFGTKLLKGKDTINTKNGEKGFSDLLPVDIVFSTCCCVLFGKIIGRQISSKRHI